MKLSVVRFGPAFCRRLDERVDDDVAVDREHRRVLVELGLVLVGPEADRLRRFVEVRVLRAHRRVQAIHRRAAQLVDQVGVGGAGAEEGRVEAGLARFADGADGLADDRAQHHQVAAGRLHPRHLRREIGRAALVRGLLGHLHVRRSSGRPRRRAAPPARTRRPGRSRRPSCALLLHHLAAAPGASARSSWRRERVLQLVAAARTSRAPPSSA